MVEERNGERKGEIRGNLTPFHGWSQGGTYNPTRRNRFLKHGCPFECHHLATTSSIAAELQRVDTEFHLAVAGIQTVSDNEYVLFLWSLKYVPGLVLFSQNQIFQSKWTPLLQQLVEQGIWLSRKLAASQCTKTMFGSSPIIVTCRKESNQNGQQIANSWLESRRRIQKHSKLPYKLVISHCVGKNKKKRSIR